MYCLTALLRNCCRKNGALDGSDNADWYAAELMARCSGAPSAHARAIARDVAKGTSEGPQACPACVKGDGGDRQICVAQQRHGPLDTPCEQVPVGRSAKGLPEGPREMSLGDTTDLSQALNRPFLVGCSVHAVLRSQQAAQQFRILVRRAFTHSEIVNTFQEPKKVFTI